MAVFANNFEKFEIIDLKKKSMNILENFWSTCSVSSDQGNSARMCVMQQLRKCLKMMASATRSMIVYKKQLDRVSFVVVTPPQVPKLSP